MSPRARTSGDFEHDTGDASVRYGLLNGHAKGSSATVLKEETSGFQEKMNAPAPNMPASKFGTIVEPKGDYKKILAVMDKLRVFDRAHEFSLPQLVVCGEQSAGKSSVLEAISGIPFPRKGTQCTRFVTQVNMWPTASRSEEETIEVILQKHGSSKGQNIFKKKITQLDELEDLIAEASKQMGVGEPRDVNSLPQEAVAEFSKDILTVSVRGHGQTPLALVDLPGMILSEGTGSAGAGGTGKIMVDEIVNEWISNENSIILAVVDTTRDPQSHSIFQKAARADPDGLRTMGVITKPDKLEPKQDAQDTWRKLALNKDPRFKLLHGWHLVRNRNEKELKENDIDRDEIERLYFESEANGWQPIVQKSKKSPATCGYGAEMLKRRLAVLLESQTRLMLPRIREQVEDKLAKLASGIKDIGIAGMEIKEAKRQFSRRCEEMSDLATKGIAGHLDKDFGLSDNLDIEDLDKGAVCYIRANIIQKDEEFAKRLREAAHNSFFAPDHSDVVPSSEKWVERVRKVLRQTAGTELQTHTDPARMSLFFHHYSDGWKKVAMKHVQEVHRVCEAFLFWVVEETIKDNTEFAAELRSKVKSQQITRIMRDRLAQAVAELEKLEKDRKRPIRTENKLFVEQSQACRDQETWRIVQKAIKTRDSSPLTQGLWLSPKYLATNVDLATPFDIRTQKAAEFIEDILIYYRIASERFVDEVLTHVNERHLLDDIKEVFAGLWRNEDGSLDKLFKNESHNLERMQHKSKQLNDEAETLQGLADELSSA